MPARGGYVGVVLLLLLALNAYISLRRSESLARHAADAHAASRSAEKPRGTFFGLVRNEDLGDVLMTMHDLEERFNRYPEARYPYIFVNDQPFTERFKRHVRASTKSRVLFDTVPREHWDVPEWINITHAHEIFEDWAERGIMYGGSQSYRQMCRYYSGFFMHHPLLKPYDFYWRFEPGVRYFCDMRGFDPFRVMRDEQKKYGWVLTFRENPATAPTLWRTVRQFMRENPNLINPKGMRAFLTDEYAGGHYNWCHFWSNFEMGSLHFLRSPEYQAYFRYLDQAKGFFYERWGDAPVHSLAVGLFLRKEEVRYFDEIGYEHPPFKHCPVTKPGTCACVPEDSLAYDDQRISCLFRWDEINGRDPKEEETKLVSLALAN